MKTINASLDKIEEFNGEIKTFSESVFIDLPDIFSNTSWSDEVGESFTKEVKAYSKGHDHDIKNAIEELLNLSNSINTNMVSYNSYNTRMYIDELIIKR